MKNRKKFLLIVGLAVLVVLLLLTFNVFLPSPQKPVETPLPKTTKKEMIQKTETPIFTTVQPYDSEYLRDPFAPLIVKRQIGQKTKSPLESYEVEELKLTGIVFDSKGSFALIEAPDGKFYVVKEKEKIGISGGIITKIGKDFIEIKETPLYGEISPKTKQLKLRTEE
jgi:type IV pilus assembly protein PilP